MSIYGRVALVGVGTAAAAGFGMFCVAIMGVDPDPETTIDRATIEAMLVVGAAVFVGAVLTAVVAGVLAFLHRAESARPPVGGPPGWYVDPLGRHRRRYWDGRSWTTWAEDDGEALSDPVGLGAAPPR